MKEPEEEGQFFSKTVFQKETKQKAKELTLQGSEFPLPTSSTQMEFFFQEKKKQQLVLGKIMERFGELFSLHNWIENVNHLS